MRARRRLVLLLLGAALAACGQDQSAQAPAAPDSMRVVTGVASKGPLQGASIQFFPLDAGGNPVGPQLPQTATTDASGRFTVSGLPPGVLVLASTNGGSYVDESDPEPNPVLRRRVDLSAGGGLNAVLPPGATSIAITPYSAALYKKAFVQAAGSNFANTYAAIRAQATSVFGFDPTTTVPADPITGAGGSQAYALLLGASALAINQIAVTGSPEHLPGFLDIIAFIDDFADGRLDSANLADLIRRFRNNNIGVYADVAAPSIDEGALSLPAVVPNAAPTLSTIANQTISEDGNTGVLTFTIADAEDAATALVVTADSSDTTLVPVSNIVLGGTGGTRSVTVTPVTNGFGTATITLTVTDTDGGAAADGFRLTVTGVNDAPVGSPTISGAATENQTLTAVTSGIADADGLGTFAFQWNRNASPIGLATASTYVLGDADVGATITVTVNYTDGQGTPESLTSAPTAAVANVNDPPTGNAVITGTATEDQTLTADASGIADADGLNAFSYSWFRNGVFVVGGTTTYVLGDADVGFAIHVEVSYTDGGGTLETVVSAPTAAVANINDAPTGTVTIDDTTPDEDQLLTAANTLADADGLGAITYAWQQADDLAFTLNVTPLSTGPTFTPGDAHVGKFLRVVASYTDGHGTAEQVASAVTAAVANVNDPPTLDVNAGLTVDQGNTAVFTTLELSASDLDDATSAIQFDVTTPPANGVIEVMGIAASGFTQADLALGFVAYNHDGSATTTDSFGFTLSDASGFSPDCPSAAPCSFAITITPGGGGGTDAVLPYVTAAGELRAVDPGDPGAPPIPIATGLPTTGFPSETLLKASGTGTTATGIHASMLVYIHDDGTGRKVWRADLEPGMSHSPTQVSNITDACDINGIAEDIRNPLNTILRIDTAGTDGVCNTADDFTTAETYLVPVSTPGASGGTQIGFGNCCGITGIADANGNLIGVLTTEDDGSGSTFDLNRRNVADLSTPVFTQSLDIAGTGQIYSRLARGFGDQHIYYRARRSGIDSTYKLLRFNVADDSVTELFDYGVTDGAQFTSDLDTGTFDAANFYFVSPDGTGIFKVAHVAPGPGQAVTLVASPGFGSTMQIEQTANRIVFRTTNAQPGVYSVPKATGSATPIAVDTTTPPAFNTLDTTDNGRVYVTHVEPGGTPEHSARAFPDSGGTPVADIPDAHWAGKTFTTTCDFNASCEDTIPAQAIFVRLGAGGTTADIEIVDPATSTQTGDLFNQIINVSQGPAVFAFGFDRYALFTFVSLIPNSDIWLGDTQAAGPGGPAGSMALISADTSGDDKWLLFGDEDGGGALDSDGDGLSDTQESTLGTDPNNQDTDNDGLTDFQEVDNDGDPNTYTVGVDTNPLAFDTDGDGLGDGQETSGTGTDPLVADTDGDDVNDGIEIAVGSNAFAPNPVTYVDPTAPCSVTCDGTSWATAWINDSFVEGAFNISGSDSINTAYVLFAAGTYGSLDLTGVNRKHVAYVGSVGPGVVNPTFPPSTTFDPGAGARALTVTQAVELTLSHIRFQNGFDATLGGGARITTPVNSEFGSNNVTLRYVEIANNTSGESGGGLVVDGGPSQVLVENSSVLGNSAQGSTASAVRGGGLLAFNDGQIFVSDSQVAGNDVTCAQAGCVALGGGGAVTGGGSTRLFFANSIVENNSAFTGAGAEASGGGLSADTAGFLEVEFSEVRNNTANGASVAQGSGGGISGIGGGDLLVEDSLIRANTSSSLVVNPPLGGGGGIYVDGNGFLGLFRTVVADNKAQAGPGGGINLVDTFNVTIEDNKFLSNSSLNPGGGLHIHPLSSTSVFNNLFVGNVSTSPSAQGGAVELDIESGTPNLDFMSNTVAYNQLTQAPAGSGGGLAVKSLSAASMELRNNNIWFNQDSSPAANVGDNYVQSVITVTGSSNNANPADSVPGNIAAPADPVFVGGFFLDQAGSPSKDTGDSGFIFGRDSPPYTTNVDGSPDGPPFDIGFHHRRASAGSFASVATTPFRTLSCASSDTFIFTPSFANAPGGEPGHLIVVELTGVTPTLGSLTTIAPRGGASRLARDLGDGRYAVTTSGFQSGSATGTFTIYADEQPTPQTFTITFTNAC